MVMHVRYERKYLVPNEQLNDLRKAIQPFVRPDLLAPVTLGFPQYTVRSIYFDSPDNGALFEKLEGFKNRKKLRLRGYDQGNDQSTVFLEIKRKLENRIAKTRVKTDFLSARNLLETANRDAAFTPETPAYEDAGRFLYNYIRYRQTPRNLVVYDREPYHGKFDSGVRITFDKNIRSRLIPALTELYDDHGLKLVWEKHFILEIKYFTDYMPSWGRSLVEDFKLSHQALSKYAEGILCHPYHESVIRS
jgi:hypothetical protein